MKFNVLTIFPDMISDYAEKSILKRGQSQNAISITPVDIRKYATNKHHTVDDTPYGGGPGMVLQVEPIFKALRDIDAVPFGKKTGLKKVTDVITGKTKKNKKTILLSPRGKVFDQGMAQEFAALDELTMICGRYEGVDQRVVNHLIDEEVSIGNYVLAGGELGALVIAEAVARLIPGVLGNPESIVGESHSDVFESEYPQYTKPVEFNGWKVPEILLSGHHEKIKSWRKKQSK